MIRLNEELITKVAELYKECNDTKIVAQMTGLKLNRVYAYLKMRGIDVRQNKDIKYNRIEELLEEGYSQADISRKLKIPKSTVSVIVFRMRQQENEPIKDASEVIINHVEDPIYYVEHNVTNEVYTYKGKRYRDVSAMWLGG